WRLPDLFLGQTCGLPYVSGRCGEAVLVARPVFDLPGARDAIYASALICRAEDSTETLAGFRGRTAVLNEFGSQSGCNALADAVADDTDPGDAPFFADIRLSGAHRASARMVAEGTADIAAIDAVAWALFAEFDPANHARLRVLAWTRPMPALPFITSKRYVRYIPVLTEVLAEPDTFRPEQPAPFESDSATPIAVAPIPIRAVPTTDADYDPIREMAERIRGMLLAPTAPRLGS
ncbi:MAG: PhnD/SsuA/transferrin family substrate-binding protein, partial [Pseudomonadota bacterium]